ncbi:MAG: hypothetical protein ACT4QD_19395 [Acidobacteriota bacterium]
MRRRLVGSVRMLAVTVVFGAGALIATAQQQKASSVDALMGAALHQEQVEGNLEAAIATYTQIVADPRTSRAMAATALLRLGQCHEKLGNAEARKAYDTLLRDYADEREVAAVARTRLAALSAAASGPAPNVPVFRRIVADFDANFQALSPDGRYAALGDGYDMAIQELQTGNKLRVRQGNPKEGGYPEGESAWSRDGKYLAYNWEYYDPDNDPDYRAELRLATSDGSGDRLLYRHDDVTHIDVYDWTPDGKHILSKLSHRDGTEDIALISATDGSVRVVKKNVKGRATLALSPDGRWVVYNDVRRLPNGSPRDLFLISTDGTHEVPLVQNPADDFVHGWSPDGRSVLFSSDRSGKFEPWLLPVSDGKPAGSPKILKFGLSVTGVHRITPAGRLYYSISVGGTDVYVGRLDPATGKLAGPLELIPTRHATAARSGVWSPDGRRLAYKTTGPIPTISVLSIDTGLERDIRLSVLALFGSIRWTRDGSALLLTAGTVTGSGRADLYRLQVETEELHLLAQAASPGPGPERSLLHSADLSPDGKTLYYLVNDQSIRARDVETGQERTLYRALDGQISGLTLSHAGDRLAAQSKVNRTGAASLLTLSVSGGEPQIVLQVTDPPEPPSGIAWTPRIVDAPQVAWSADGRHLFFATAPAKGPNQVLWRVAAQGGTPERVGLTMENIGVLSFHPDGKRFAVTAGRPTKSELWVIENFPFTATGTQEHKP